MKKDLINILPMRIYDEIMKQWRDDRIFEEIRIRRGRQAYCVICGQNVMLNSIATDEEMEYILKKITNDSLYTHKESISNGYITFSNGLRIGVIGKASIEDKKIIGVHSINEYSIRIPNRILINCKEIFDRTDFFRYPKSILIYSPPGVGKTTLLRSMIKIISKGNTAKRVAIIDSRDELAYDLDERYLLVSMLSGYPRKEGIEIAVRVMNPQVIVCDEIGDEKDASAIIDAQGAGVPIIASCHGNSLQDIFSHRGIQVLHRAHIFDYYIGISRKGDLENSYKIDTWEEANAHN